jgi:hypothetical protein
MAKIIWRADLSLFGRVEPFLWQIKKAVKRLLWLRFRAFAN